MEECQKKQLQQIQTPRRITKKVLDESHKELLEELQKTLLIESKQE